MEEDPKSSLLDYASTDPANSKLQNLMSQFSAPASRLLIFQIAGMIAVLVLAWVIVSTILSFLNAWIIVLLACVLGAVVWFREMKQRQREIWILQGHCANCGYDLRASPEICPECGRDAALDEPIWRKTRRQLEAKLVAQNASLPPGADTEPPVIIRTRPVLVDEGPIPLEGDDQSAG